MQLKIKTLLNEESRLKHFTNTIKLRNSTLYIDFSKTHLTLKDLHDYRERFNSINLTSKIEAMFNREPINFTEQKPVLHTKLRHYEVLKLLKKTKVVRLDSDIKEAHREFEKMRNLADEIKHKQLKGCTGKPIDTIINIGIGGSDLGPRMVCEALQYYKVDGIKVHFISNVDGAEGLTVINQIDFETSLFIVVSKTFTTPETLTNFNAVEEIGWHKIKRRSADMNEADFVKKHFVAVSANEAEAERSGIKRFIRMPDCVGGRFSLWSGAGLIIAIYVGFDHFIELLTGASSVDSHFKTEDMENNAIVNQAIVECFYDERGYNNKCVVPYDFYLSKLPAYLQQAEMESNGKSVTHQNKRVKKGTAMIIWGEPGTNAQHSFFQCIHQGTRHILVQFLVGLKPVKQGCVKMNDHHDMLYANCVAQGEALMLGKHDENAHKCFEGDKPSITIVYEKLTPEVLGGLIALMEHKIFVQGIYWGINSWDQMGVDLGKKLAKQVYEDLGKGEIGERDFGTNRLIKMRMDAKWGDEKE